MGSNLHIRKTGFAVFTALMLSCFVQSAVAQIPVFQYAIFYNLNLEMDPTPPMVINGPVFCNQSIWATSVNSLTFNSTVQAVGTVTTNTSTDPFANGYEYGGDWPVFSLAGQPTSGNQPLIIRVGNFGNNNPTNAEAILNLPPTSLGAPNTIAYAPSNQVYLFNECDLIISNAAWGTNGIAFNGANGTNVNTQTSNVTMWFQDSREITPLTPLTNDYVKLKLTTGSYTNFTFHMGGLNATNTAATNILYAGFSFVTNVSFYDWREGYNGGSGPPKAVQAVQIDIAKFNKWLYGTNANGIRVQGYNVNHTILDDLGHGIGSIYIYNSVPPTGSQLPAVRLVNGGTLPTNYPGLTIATPQPLYIYGNYNVSNNLGSDLGKSTTIHTYPAAVLADAVTILSPSWNDAISDRFPAVNIDSTVNAAVLEGIVPSNTNIVGSYSGGIENSLRYVEDWSGNTNTYNGSIVVMFPSIYATNYYKSGGNYYNPPSRNWSFDLNFRTASGLPPLTPSVGYLPPAIIVQPLSQTIAFGSNVTFGIAAISLLPVNFQWQLNGTNIQGGTIGGTNVIPFNTSELFGIASYFSLTLTNVQFSQSGNYSVQLYYGLFSTNSSSALLTVLAPPAITMQPTNQTLVAGQSAIFRVIAGGGTPLSYQWQFNSTNLVGATNTTLTLNDTTTNQTGAYSVTVTNAVGTVTSSNAVLSVYSSAAPTMNTASFSGSTGFQFQVAGVPGFNYAVQASTNLVDWISLITNTSPFSFTDTNTPGFQQRFYRSIYLQ
jgi:hypothetical protein